MSKAYVASSKLRCIAKLLSRTGRSEGDIQRAVQWLDDVIEILDDMEITEIDEQAGKDAMFGDRNPHADEIFVVELDVDLAEALAIANLPCCIAGDLGIER